MTLGILDAKEHSRIIQDFDRVCSQAGIQGHFLYDSMTKYCGPTEVEWVKRFWKFKAEGLSGLALVGVNRPDTRCQAMAAALVRNYVDARVIPVNTLIDHAMNGGTVPSPTVLLVPNLFMVALSKSTPAWRAQIVYDILLERSTKSKPSVVYVENMAGLKSVYGEPFRDFLSRFTAVTE